MILPLPTPLIDRWFAWFWRHLRGLGLMFDTVICANAGLAARLERGGVANSETLRMGVEDDLFSPALRSAILRREALEALGLSGDATLLVGIGRFSAEKRWEMVLRAVGDARRRGRRVGMLLIGDGPRRWKLELLAQRTGALLVPRVDNREDLARLLASADALVHGCEAETFCMVAAEARASGVPIIVPDRGAALDQAVPGAGAVYRAASETALEQAIGSFIDRGPSRQRIAALRACRVRTMDDHFAELFARYEALGGRCWAQPVSRANCMAGELSGELALARSAARRT